MKYMVIETFKPGKNPLVYGRFGQQGRMLPDGLTHIDSWVEQGGDRCLQPMETEEPELLDLWIAKWNDLVDFEVVPVTPSPTTTDSSREP